MGNEIESIKAKISGIIGQNHNLIAIVEEEDVIGIRKVSISICHEANTGKSEDVYKSIRAEIAPILEQIINILINEGYSVSDNTKTLNSFIGNDGLFRVFIRCSKTPILKQREQLPSDNLGVEVLNI